MFQIDLKRVMVSKGVSPFLFATYPILFLFAHNIDRASFGELGLPLAISLSIAAIIWLFFSVIFWDLRKSSVFTTLVMFLLFSYGHVFAFSGGLVASYSDEQRHKLLIIAWAVILTLGFLLIRKAVGDMEKLSAFFNIMGVVMVLIPLLSISFYYLNQAERAFEVSSNSFDRTVQKDKDYPDIYYIVLDGYARADVLTELYNYDNSEFLSFLKKKGFYVATKSTSNYNQTSLSTASSLNLAYIQDLLPYTIPRMSNKAPLDELVENPKVADILRGYGYRFVVFKSGYSGTEVKKADLYFSAPGSLTEFQNVLLNTTVVAAALGPLVKSVNFQYEDRRKQLLWSFAHIPDLTRSETPVFVYAHILAPHPPFVFGPAGESKNPNQGFDLSDGSHYYEARGNTKATYIKGYRGQLHFVNQLVKSTISKILTKSKQPPIIIVQSDHGPGSEFDQQSPMKTNIKERMSILNAFYFPDKDYSRLHESVTPVNNFRILLNKYFQETTLLPDKNYFAPWNRPYKFFDVSDQVEK